MPRVVHFELLSDDPEQSVKFFEDAFGWKNQSWEGQTYWLVDTGEASSGSTAGSCARATSRTPRTRLTLDVDDIGEALAKVEAAGGKVIAPERQVGEAAGRLRRRPRACVRALEVA